jgi:hypothetical protein
MSWARLQSASQDGGTTSITRSYESDLTAGSVMICAATQYAQAATAVHDGSGNPFALLAFCEIGNVSLYVSLWALATPAGDAGTRPTITVTLAGDSGGYASMLIQEIGGITAAPDGTPGTAIYTDVAGPVGPPSYASSASGEYLLYMFGDNGYGIDLSPPAGYTADPASILDTGGASCQLAIAYKSSTGGTESGQYNWTGGTDRVGLIMTAMTGPALPVAAAGLLLSAFPG